MKVLEDKVRTEKVSSVLHGGSKRRTVTFVSEEPHDLFSTPNINLMTDIEGDDTS
jgi:hypothetical protein